VVTNISDAGATIIVPEGMLLPQPSTSTLTKAERWAGFAQPKPTVANLIE
jgi:hypothetical protein